jgi:hypothetical protein
MCVVVQFLEIGQVFGQVSDVIVGPAKALHFCMKGLVSFLLDGEVDHRHKSLSRKEGVPLFAREDSSGVRVFSCSEGARVTGAVASPREQELWVVWEEVISVEGGVNRAPPQSRDGVVMLWGHSFDTTMPVMPGYDSEFFDDFRGWRMWAIVEVWRWRPGVWFVWRSCPRQMEKVKFLDGYLRVSDDEQLVDVRHGRAVSGLAWVVERVEVSIVPKDLYNSMKDHSSWSLRGLVVLPHDEDATTDCSGGGIKDVRSRVPGLIVVAEHLYCDAQELPASFSFFIAIVGLIAWVEH